jgi:hypothetical protein
LTLTEFCKFVKSSYDKLVFSSCGGHRIIPPVKSTTGKTPSLTLKYRELCVCPTVLWIRDILVRIRMRIREAQKHTDPTDPDDPDLEHWCIYIILQR